MGLDVVLDDLGLSVIVVCVKGDGWVEETVLDG